MNFPTLLNGSILFIGLGLVAFSKLSGFQIRVGIEEVDSVGAEVSADAIESFDGVIPEVWQVKEGSVYDGDTLRVIRGSEELKMIRFCGMQRGRVVRRQDDWQCESIARP